MTKKEKQVKVSTATGVSCIRYKIVQQYLKTSWLFMLFTPNFRPQFGSKGFCLVPMYSASLEIFCSCCVSVGGMFINVRRCPPDASGLHGLICSSLVFLTSSSKSATFTIRHLYAITNIITEIINVQSYPDWFDLSTSPGTVWQTA